MTTIAALISEGRVWMAGDSQVTLDDTKMYTSDPKVWRVPLGRTTLVVGTAGSSECDMVVSGIDWARGVLTWQKQLHTAQTRVECAELLALIGHKRRLWVYENGQMWTVRGKCEAIGSGADYALGYLHASQGDPRVRVRKAVKGSGQRSTYVGGKVVDVCT